ncbi:hypothetical protein H257_08983 [Aphanomyces astaci]|uniref:Uncharacterized protein n=1 Tax=Aphanomyces astaci TaxID=112090 RepID=W4GDS2_APHAT|nr:hypothetical protein H257_08983 [Aphanomyces astaci]ETV77083.1 hypothetical protein H257_08983 [Aphanomyces astaci]|eukprot:XP_009833389.1 hypothetical protein H257_08983 [Aphanomyces astaci]
MGHSLTEVAATDLYERVIAEFGSNRPQDQVDRTLRHKPPEYFDVIAQRLRKRLALYTGVTTVDESSSLPLDPEDASTSPSADTQATASAAPFPSTNHPDDSNVPQMPLQLPSLLLIPNRQHPPFHVDLNAIGRPAPTMANPHQPSTDTTGMLPSLWDRSKAPRRGRPKGRTAAPPSSASEPSMAILVPPPTSTTTSSSIPPPRGGLVGVYATTKFTPRTCKRQFALVAALVRLYEPWRPTSEWTTSSTTTPPSTPHEMSSATMVMVAMNNDTPEWAVATIVPDTDDDQQGGGVLVQLVESGTQSRVPRHHIFVGVDHFVAFSGTAVVQIKEQSAAAGVQEAIV